ncbi:MAG: PIN domain-containing protein [Verrucomicrobiota bacterium]
MKLLADTNLFVKFAHLQPLPDEVEETFDDAETVRHLSAVSVIEIYWLWKNRRLIDHPDDWLELALDSWTILPVTAPIARQSVLWDWPHRDPADRIIAATAKIEKIELWHTDTILKKLSGFPNRYFVNKLRAR